MISALFNAGAVGYLFTRNATVAGAEGGCQAEVGVASAMAASAAAELLGGSAEACLNAAAIAITNILGLVCDPAGGLVENPCQQRNAMGAANALVAAELSLAGISNAAPFDEAVTMMYNVGALCRHPCGKRLWAALPPVRACVPDANNNASSLEFSFLCSTTLLLFLREGGAA